MLSTAKNFKLTKIKHIIFRIEKILTLVIAIIFQAGLIAWLKRADRDVSRSKKSAIMAKILKKIQKFQKNVKFS
jgi:hypothetical protein